MLTEPGENRLNALRSREPVEDLAAAEQHELRNAPHAESRRKGQILLGIDLDDSRFSSQFLCYGPHRRRE